MFKKKVSDLNVKECVIISVILFIVGAIISIGWWLANWTDTFDGIKNFFKKLKDSVSKFFKREKRA